MKRQNYRIRKKTYMVIWFMILCLAIYLLIQLISLLFSNEIGQAKGKFNNIVMSRLCINAFETSSSLIEFSSVKKEENLTYPILLFAKEFPVQNFLREDNVYASTYNIKIEGQANKQTNTLIEGKVRYKNIFNGKLNKDYILSNGTALNNNINSQDVFREMPVDIIEGNFDLEKKEDIKINEDESALAVMRTYDGSSYTMEQLKDVNFLVNKFYIVDGGTRVTDKLFDSQALLGKEVGLKQDNDKPQILIYHTHSQEAFIDSKAGDKSESVVGVGEFLAKILRDDYGYNVIHDKSEYDIAQGREDRNKAYDYARVGVKKILDENPTIEVVIDLHRDGAPKRSITINGEETAQIMLLNGLSRDQKGPITYLENPNIQDNLAFSLQLQIKSLKMYPKFFYKNYLNCYRYNLDLRQKSILVELGTHKNTLQSALNAIEPFAEVLDAVLKGE